MRAAEAGAIAAGRATGLSLMARAADGLAAAIRDRWPAARSALVLCGPGANGGDGFAAARLLRGMGLEVRVAALGAPAEGSDAAAMRAAWAPLGPVARLGAADGPTDILVDALFGTGLGRRLAPEAEAALHAARAGATVAVDCPSGLDLESGRALGAPRAADLTVTFHRAKLGHYLGDGPALCGRLVRVDIGLGDAADENADENADGGPARLARLDWAALAKRPGAHKYDHGHVLVLAGGVGRGGAARLGARAALRVGAGLVTVAPPPAALIENAARLDAVMLRAVADAAGLAAALQDPRFTALLLGPGLGVGERTRALVLTALESGRAVVLDADALTSFADDPAPLFARCAPDRVVMTPHAGEFRRLFPGAAGSPVAAAQAAAVTAGAVVLLKGPCTVVATPGAAPLLCAAVYDDAAPWLATAGSGDVLAGLIAGLLARGFAAADAAATAALLHQAAGRAAGPGLVAEDLPEAVATVLRGALGAGGHAR